MKSRFNQAGFSLTEIMIGLGLVSIIMAAIMAVNQTAMKTIRGTQLSSEAVTMVDQAKIALSNSATCKANFAIAPRTVTFQTNTLSSQSVSVSRIILPAAGAPPVLDTAAPPVSGLKTSSIRLANFRELIPGKAYLTDLELKFSKTKRDSFFGSSEVKKSFSLFLETDVSGNTATVTNCALTSFSGSSDVAVAVQQTCLATGGTWNPGSQQCSLPLPAPDQLCSSLGENWASGKCIPPPEPVCTSFGAGWGWNGTKCVPPASSALTVSYFQTGHYEGGPNFPSRDFSAPPAHSSAITSGTYAVYAGEDDLTMKHHWSTSQPAQITVSYKYQSGSCMDQTPANWTLLPAFASAVNSNSNEQSQAFPSLPWSTVQQWIGCTYRFMITATNGTSGSIVYFDQKWELAEPELKFEENGQSSSLTLSASGTLNQTIKWRGATSLSGSWTSSGGACGTSGNMAWIPTPCSSPNQCFGNHSNSFSADASMEGCQFNYSIRAAATFGGVTKNKEISFTERWTQ